MPFIAQVAVGKLREAQVFGDDYRHPDGTALRDYIHVEDLAAGHLAALDQLGTTDERVSTWNLGTGHGTSVLRCCTRSRRPAATTSPTRSSHAVRATSPRRMPTRHGPSASSGWKATRTIEDICADQWRWQRGNPLGYPD